MAPRIGIFSLKDDLHALAVQHRLQHAFGAECLVVETDDLASSGGLGWSTGDRGGPPVLRSRNGDWFDIGDLDLIWWRRANYPQRGLPPAIDETATQLISNEWRYALVGMLTTSFRGVWVNEPTGVHVTENKLVQLSAASRAGLPIPRTLVSQDPETVRAFCAQQQGNVIVKAVRGLTHQPLRTSFLDIAAMDDDSIRLCPAIYQEFVPGQRHVRICCFGDRVIAAALDSQELDWRWNLNNVAFQPLELADAVQRQLRAVLDELGIRMAIMDAKFRRDDELVWLEANPQGQFLFLEGITGLDLLTPFCEFLIGVIPIGSPAMAD
jgi:hypothetical protein